LTWPAGEPSRAQHDIVVWLWYTVDFKKWSGGAEAAGFCILKAWKWLNIDAKNMKMISGNVTPNLVMQAVITGQNSIVFKWSFSNFLRLQWVPQISLLIYVYPNIIKWCRIYYAVLATSHKLPQLSELQMILRGSNNWGLAITDYTIRVSLYVGVCSIVILIPHLFKRAQVSSVYIDPSLRYNKFCYYWYYRYKLLHVPAHFCDVKLSMRCSLRIS